MTRIPRRFHMLWSGPSFPYVNRLAVESLMRTNPRAGVTVYFENPPTRNPHWDAVGRLVQMRPLPEVEWIQRYGVQTGRERDLRRVFEGIPPGYPAGRSNVWRYLALYLDGGVYLDFDLLVLKNFDPLLEAGAFAGNERVFRFDADRVRGDFTLAMAPGYAAFGVDYAVSRIAAAMRWGGLWEPAHRLLQRIWGEVSLNNAVLGSEAGHPFFARILELLPQVDPRVRFNLGPILLNRVWNEGRWEGFVPHPERAFYPIPPSQSFRYFHPRAPCPDFTSSYAVHWCYSNHRKAAARLTQSEILERSGPPAYHQLARRFAAPRR